jgi:hypothetical protein
MVTIDMLLAPAGDDLANVAVCNLNDLTTMVAQARNKWDDTPKYLLVDSREGSDEASGLISVDRGFRVFVTFYPL